MPTLDAVTIVSMLEPDTLSKTLHALDMALDMNTAAVSARSASPAGTSTTPPYPHALTLTGVVAQRTIMTIEDQASEGINPFNLLADLGKRSVAALYGQVAGLLKSHEKPKES